MLRRVKGKIFVRKAAVEVEWFRLLGLAGAFVTILARKVGCNDSAGRSWSKEWIARRKQVLQENIDWELQGLEVVKREKRRVGVLIRTFAFTMQGPNGSLNFFFECCKQAPLQYRTENEQIGAFHFPKIR
jgi:hypothetical protein